jgi:hypothetical protein
VSTVIKLSLTARYLPQEQHRRGTRSVRLKRLEIHQTSKCLSLLHLCICASHSSKTTTNKYYLGSQFDRIERLCQLLRLTTLAMHQPSRRQRNLAMANEHDPHPSKLSFPQIMNGPYRPMPVGYVWKKPAIRGKRKEMQR